MLTDDLQREFRAKRNLVAEMFEQNLIGAFEHIAMQTQINEEEKFALSVASDITKLRGLGNPEFWGC